jgi:hypothetical protein
MIELMLPMARLRLDEIYLICGNCCDHYYFKNDNGNTKNDIETTIAAASVWLLFISFNIREWLHKEMK